MIFVTLWHRSYRPPRGAPPRPGAEPGDHLCSGAAHGALPAITPFRNIHERQQEENCGAGAGPAGLMAAWRLRQASFAVTLFEQEPVVGGMCATQTFKGRDGEYRFDYGGHRFITKNPSCSPLSTS